MSIAASSPHARSRTAGVVCGAAGLVGAVGCAYLALAGSAGGAFSYPQAVRGSTGLQMAVALSNVGLIAGLLGLRGSGAQPRRLPGRLGSVAAVAAVAGLTVAEGIGVTASVRIFDATPSAFGVVYFGYTLLLATALLLLGFDLAVDHRWPAWRKRLPISLGAWLMIVVAPALVVGFEAALWALAAWHLMCAVLGAVLVLAAGEPESRARRNTAPATARGVAILTWTYAAGFGGAAIPVAAYLSQNGTLPRFLDVFTMYGEGSLSERLSDTGLTVAMLAFFMVTLAASWAAWLLWTGSKFGAVFALLLLPVEVWFWIGFALPLPWLFGVLRLLLIAMAWTSLAWPWRADSHSAGGLRSSR